MKNSIEQIYHYVESNGLVTITQISQHLGLTKADIRHHTNALIQAGRVKSAGQIPIQSAGRPAALFEIIPSLNPLLVERLLEGYSALLKKKEIPDEEINGALVSSLLADFHPQGSPTACLNQAIVYLKEMGIQAKWEAGAEGPNITLADSPLTSPRLLEKLCQTILPF